MTETAEARPTRIPPGRSRSMRSTGAVAAPAERPGQLLRRKCRHRSGAPYDERPQAGALQGLAAAAGTAPRELRAFEADAFDPAVVGSVGVPVLMLVGADSPAELQADPEVVAEALPDVRIDVLAGQAHLAHLADPEAFAARVLAFVDD